MNLIAHDDYAGMYYIEWPNGDRSIDTPNSDKKGGHYGFYNLTNAKEIMRRKGIEDYERGKTYGDPMGRTETGSTAI